MLIKSIKHKISLSLYLFLFVISYSGQILASDKTAESADDIPEPKQFISEHKGVFNGKKITYLVNAGETYLRDHKGEAKAAIFTFAYSKKTNKGKSNRPVTFIWNGGPGSSSTWLHMGAYGPKRIVVPSDAKHPGSAPYEILDATETILDVSDLVFIDPVGTGFSRALGKHKGKEFWGLKEDANSMAEFIRTWLTENNRWNSPRFLLGESFGTTRAALVANILESKLSISLNGLVFVSQALDYQGSTPYVRDNLISHITYIPTMAATAFYHDKVQPKPASLPVFLEQARTFATDELMPALFKGNTLDDKTRAHITKRLSYFTGLDVNYIKLANLRVQGHRFAKELLREQGLSVGNLDSRYIVDEIDNLNPAPRYDASRAISSAYNAALRNYMQNDLGVNWHREYLAPADPNLSSQWRWRPVPDNKSWEPAYVNTARDLSNALRINPSLKVFVASGYYDLVTPFFDAEYTLNRHGISADKVRYEYYHGGHMMYVNEPSRLELLKDTRDFIQQQLK